MQPYNIKWLKLQKKKTFYLLKIDKKTRRYLNKRVYYFINVDKDKVKYTAIYQDMTNESCTMYTDAWYQGDRFWELDPLYKPLDEDIKAEMRAVRDGTTTLKKFELEKMFTKL